MRADGDKRRDRVFGFGDYSLDAPSPSARLLYLAAVEQCVPAAFAELKAIPPDDRAGIHEWAQARGFTDAWALRAAEQLVSLRRDGSRAFPPVSAYAFSPVFPPAPAWDPTMETEVAYRSRIEKYIADVKVTPGIRPTPIRREPLQFEWLALHHVDRWKLRRISERYQDADGNPGESAISRGITEVAALIGLTLRPGRGRKVVVET